ncbi:alpha/beta hydrolase [Sinomicrobium weinanense]|uniref:Alpha/beta hydrolase n=1 Tax=Sinomicrobium weinanense TaxID=2842200 RepID=A0A926JR69_9FLAO|nr:alpha/beta hydrolase [Sinomicrobium weinanense]MBC9795992.1 alpha/beta hydrolase [Sinomicrobium weinanense]MBU3122111.1 alpha/beta hydrolase [Sinomicrobium weinanense]
MNTPKISVYFMPGMAASPLIFEHIRLPEDRFEMHFLEWVPAHKNETLKEYAGRMCEKIDRPAPVLVGVSFGGILVQEMAAYIRPAKVIIISSVKCKKELPAKMLFARYTGMHKLLPTGLVNNVELLAKYAFGEAVVKRLELYKRYLTVPDREYMDWAINAVVRWDQEEAIPGIVHIHGEKDPVFPIARIKNCIRIKQGTHIMIINRYKWFNEHLPSLIES